MKKNILLILLVMITFLVGGNEVFAAPKCSADEEGNIEECIDEVKDYIEGIGANYQLLCLYNVEFDNGGTSKNYINYIYYNLNNGKFWAGTSLGGFDEELKEDKNAWLLGGAYDGLYENKTCPTHGYIDKKGTSKEVCFDNGGESDCLNNGEKLNSGTNFNNTLIASQTGNLIEKNTEMLDYANLSYRSVCDVNNLPDGYSKACRYINEATDDYVLLIYNNSHNMLIYVDGDSKTLIREGESGDQLGGAIGNSILYNSYKNNINSPLNSCPNSLYLNNSVNPDDSNNNYGLNVYDYFSWDLDKTDLVREYKRSNCGDNEYIPPDDDPTCGDLIDGELREIINDIMAIIRIAVPILLIGLVTYDFATAVFAGDEKAVNKAKSKAIKRIIIAVVIFFVPTLLNFLFNIVNTIWTESNLGTCEIEK